ncbi:PrpF protein [Lasallia pustulata]|uniref:PrpF protein n=1 Tax=Lasallia pustulata TaxID=136370 RepID=A0A1W5D535_9LECA|nr:PrpF protein [Lasallia pustulata]
MAGTGAICTAAASRMFGTVVHEMMSAQQIQRSEDENVLRIQHPLGNMPVAVRVRQEVGRVGTNVDFETLSFVRTARRILKDEIDVPEDVREVYEKGMMEKRAEGSKSLDVAGC